MIIDHPQNDVQVRLDEGRAQRLARPELSHLPQGPGNQLTMYDRGEEGVQKPPNFGDIICEQSLMRTISWVCMRVR